jgi:hypothetical protein
MKVTKRDFVKGAAATLTVATVAVDAVARTLAADSFDVVVYNEWFPQARAFANQISVQGARALPVEGDAGRLWYGTLRGLIAGGHRRIAGMTTHTDLFILKTLARDHGLRVSERGSEDRLVSWVLI